MDPVTTVRSLHLRASDSQIQSFNWHDSKQTQNFGTHASAHHKYKMIVSEISFKDPAVDFDRRFLGSIPQPCEIQFA